MANLIFSDEFNGSSVDSNKWNVKHNYHHSASPNTCMDANNVFMSNGNIVIRSRNDYNSVCGDKYSSGYFDSKDKFSFKYGYAEIRAKLPKGKGIWPAFWLLPSSGDWPPEIDIFEMLGHQPSKLYFTVHAEGCNDPNCGGWSCCKSGSYTGVDYSADYHTFGMEWTSSYIKWYVDGTERFNSTQYVPQENMFLVFDTFVGGDWPGNPDSTTVFPQYYYTDYVRVYDSKPTAPTTVPPTTVPPTTVPPTTVPPTTIPPTTAPPTTVPPTTIPPTTAPPTTVPPTTIPPTTIPPTTVPPTTWPPWWPWLPTTAPPTTIPPTGKRYKCLPVIDWTIPAITTKCIESPTGKYTEDQCKALCKAFFRLDDDIEEYLYASPEVSKTGWLLLGALGGGALVCLLTRKK